MGDNFTTIYTDGSCHTQRLIGAWVAIIFLDGNKIILSGIEKNTTHNRMELMAIIKGIEYFKAQQLSDTNLTIITDSQYAIGLQKRQEKFITQNFITKKGNEISNADLVKILLNYINTVPVTFVKIKAHQQATTESIYNIEADKLSRYLVREVVNQ